MLLGKHSNVVWDELSVNAILFLIWLELRLIRWIDGDEKFMLEQVANTADNQYKNMKIGKQLKLHLIPKIVAEIIEAICRDRNSLLCYRPLTLTIVVPNNIFDGTTI